MNNLKQEFTDLKHSKNHEIEKDWDLIWVLSGKKIDLTKGSNDTKNRFETGIRLAKKITRVRTSKKIDVDQILKYGPKIYFSGYNEHNVLLKQLQVKNYFEKKYDFPKENILIGPMENNLHTDNQFINFPEKFIKDNRKIIILTDAYHIPRCKRYLKKYSSKFEAKKFIFYKSQPENLKPASVKSEMNKIIEYSEKGILPDLSKKPIVVVTGSTGFIGSHLIQKLKEQNIEFRVFDKKIHNFSDVKSLSKLVSSCTAVFHLAGIISEDKKELEFNLKSTKNLITAIKISSPDCRLIFASSFAVYKTPDKGKIVNEKSEITNIKGYGLSKLKCEEIIRKNLPKSLILRLSNVYGPNMPPFKHSVIATYIHQMKNDNEIIVKNSGLQTRDFIYIDDVTHAFILSLENASTKRVLNICSGKEASLLTLIKLLEKVLNKKAVIKQIPSQKNSGFWKADNSLARKVLGWQPKIKLTQGLKLSAIRSK